MGEFSWIARVQDGLGDGLALPFGIGDDAAVMASATRQRVIASDMMVEGVHFDRRWSSLADVAYKLYASNASDMLAMGASVRGWLLSVALPADLSASAHDAWIEGARAAQADWGHAPLIGGDTTRSLGGLVASITMFGDVRDHLWARSGFRPGQRLWCDGELGLAAAGLALLQAGVSDDRFGAIAQHRRPRRWPAAQPTGVFAGFDVSDGLSADLLHGARASDCAMVIDAPLPGVDRLLDLRAHYRDLWTSMDATAPALPATNIAQRGDRRAVDAWQLGGGDDYVRVIAADHCPGDGWHAIGYVESGPVGLYDARDGARRPLDPRGWDHFRPND